MTETKLSQTLQLGSLLGGVILSAWALSSCMSMQGGPGPEAAVDSSKQPYVEAYIEFTGPNLRWAGPQTLLIHAVAKMDQPVELTMKPDLFPEVHEVDQTKPQDGPTVQNRKLASEASHQPKYSGDVLRASLGDLAEAIKNNPDSFQGCMYPLRVRLIRADGTLTDSQGCRGMTGWPRFASEKASEFMYLISSGIVPKPQRAPAAATHVDESESLASKKD